MKFPVSKIQAVKKTLIASIFCSPILLGLLYLFVSPKSNSQQIVISKDFGMRFLIVKNSKKRHDLILAKKTKKEDELNSKLSSLDASITNHPCSKSSQARADEVSKKAREAQNLNEKMDAIGFFGNNLLESASCGWNREEYNSMLVKLQDSMDELVELKKKNYEIYNITLTEQSFFNQSKKTDNKIIDCSSDVFLDNDTRSICDVLDE